MVMGVLEIYVTNTPDLSCQDSCFFDCMVLDIINALQALSVTRFKSQLLLSQNTCGLSPIALKNLLLESANI